MTPQDFAAMLTAYPRLVLCGPPESGKTTRYAAVAHDRPVVYTDDYIGMAWDDVGPALVADCHSLKSYLLEGVRAPWALRAGLECDAVLWVERPGAVLNDGQRGISMAARKVLDDWLMLGIPVPYFEREAA